MYVDSGSTRPAFKFFNAFVSFFYSPVNSVESHNQPGDNLDRLPKELFLIRNKSRLEQI